VILHNEIASSSSLRPGGKVQHLVDPIFKCDQISRHEFITSASEFVPVTNIEEFPKTFVGIKTHAIPIGNSDEYQVEKLFQAG
jgi:hypothetical protein